MRKLVVILVVGLLFVGGASGALVESNFGTAADADVTIGDLDGVTSGGSWENLDNFPGSDARFNADTAGENVAFFWEGGSSGWWTRGGLNFDEPIDFSQDELSINYDQAWSYSGSDKELRLQAKDSSGNTVFTLGWSGEGGAKRVGIIAGDVAADYMKDAGNSTTVSANYDKDFGTEHGNVYDPDGMGSFNLALQGSKLTVTLGDGSTESITDLTQSDVASLEFGFRGKNFYRQEMWLDNIEVIPEPVSIGLLGVFGILFWIRRRIMGK